MRSNEVPKGKNYEEAELQSKNKIQLDLFVVDDDGMGFCGEQQLDWFAVAEISVTDWFWAF